MKVEYQPPRYSDKELLNIFPEVGVVIGTMIYEREKLKRVKEQVAIDILRELKPMSIDQMTRWCAEELIKTFIVSDVVALEREIRRLKYLEVLSHKKRGSESDYQSQLDRARSYPIEEIARSGLKVKNSGNKLASLCPFHKEKTPSFYVYPDSNSFHCFGCQEHGDVIKLTMALYGVDFKDAVKMLQNSNER